MSERERETKKGRRKKRVGEKDWASKTERGKEKGKRQRRGKRKRKEKERGEGYLRKKKKQGERESNRARKGRRHKLLPVTNIAAALID